MFDIHNYDKDEYEKERKERLVQESDIKSEEEYKQPKEQLHEEPRQEVEGSSKRALIGILLLGTVGFIGYLALGNQKNDTNSIPTKTEPTSLVQENNTKESESTNQDKPKEELITTTTTVPAIKAEPKEESITTTTQPKQDRQNIIGNDALTDTIQKELLNISTSSPTPTKEKEPVVTTISQVKDNPIEPESTPTPVVKEDPTATPTPTITPTKEPIVKKVHTKPKRKHAKAKHKKVVKKPKRRFVIVRRGDTLASISKKFYGNSMKFKRIIRANYSIKSSSTPLKIGQRIYVPR
jgi:nucleoid-associated protein YgaU